MPGSLHRVPRHPHAWLWALAVLVVLSLAAGWRFGAWVGVVVFLLGLAPFWWATLVPDSRLFSPVLSRLPLRDKRVWLTIDDGPSAQTAAILDLLDAHGAKATFFLVGERALARPGAVREIVRRGHGIGNHSDSHPETRFWRLPPWSIAREVDTAQATLAQLAGTPPRWFRAVVGMANPFVAAALRRHGLARVAWSARGFDGRVGDPARVIARLRRQLAPGAIVLAHEGAPHGRSVEVIAALLAMLDAAGYRTVLPEQLDPALQPVPDGANARA